MDKKTAIEKAVDTIKNIQQELDDMPSYDFRKLNLVENHIRVELQVMEALVNHVGREVYQAVQIRRQQLRNDNNRKANNIVDPVEERLKAILGEDNGSDRANGDTGVGDGTNKPRRAKRKGNSKTRRPAGQSKHKK